MSYYRPFRKEHCLTAKYEAQRQLSGITHYVDDDTLRYFKCRILRVIFSEDGLTLGLIMSQPNYEKNDKREYKAALINVFGSIRDYREFYDTKAEAVDALNELRSKTSIEEWIKESAESHKLQAANESEYIIDLLYN
tara:strand:- start:529 stop:939 length:411 start_codon:yes stop_codon:yes gene_type:complete